MAIIDDLKSAVIDMEVEKAAELTQKALDEGLDAKELLNQALIPAMDIVGEQYERGERYVPEMLLSAHAMKGAMEKLRLLLAEAGVEPRGKVVIGTVEGDLHDIGKNLVAMMLEGAGFEITDLGTEVTADEFIQALKERQANILGMSALLTTTMTQMPKVIEALKKNGLREKVKVMIGGAPLSQEYADEFGADGYAPDAASAVELAKRLVAERKG